MIALHQNVANCQNTLTVLTQKWRIFLQDIWISQMRMTDADTTQTWIHTYKNTIHTNMLTYIQTFIHTFRFNLFQIISKKQSWVKLEPQDKYVYTYIKDTHTTYIHTTIHKYHTYYIQTCLHTYTYTYIHVVVLCRARIGHTHLTHSYILRKDPPPLCEHCQCILTVRHILVECNHFAQERKDIFGRRDVVESFRFHPTLIVLFLKQIEFYYKLKKS